MAWSAARRLESLKKEAGRQKLIRNMERFWGDAASGTCNPVRTGANQDKMMSQTNVQRSRMKAGEWPLVKFMIWGFESQKRKLVSKNTHFFI